jgi:tetratricopeptide (TPR) repeat protein
MNQEGLAELDYARGSAAISGRNSADAIQFLQRSLDEASMISSVQLRIRVLTQLSSATSRSDTRLAAKYAEQAIRLARENQLDAWAADGLVRLADAQIHGGDLQRAEGSLQEALQLTRQTQQLRVEALANLTLASLMNQKHLPEEVIGPAQAALDYYNKNGYFSLGATASLLLIRTERDKGQYQQALKSGNAFLALATKSGVNELMRQAEEVVGSVFFEMEQYPDALIHFMNAKSLADTASTKAYGAINYAEALWRLGRYSEAETSLQFTPANDGMASMVGAIRASLLASNGRYREARALSRQLLAQYPKMTSQDRHEIEIDIATAEVHLGMKEQALRDLAALESEDGSGDPAEASRRNRIAAEVDLFAGLVPQAYEAARAAATHYASTEQLDSELQSTYLAAIASNKMDPTSEESRRLSAQALDIISEIQHTWNPQVSKTYLSRPDLQMLIHGLPLGSHK